MWLDKEKISFFSRKNNESLNALLKRAGVSKTAYYSLIRNSSILPRSVLALADALEVESHKLLSWSNPEIEKVKSRQRKMKKVLSRYPKIDRENAWHTLVLLELSPFERLEGALRRGQKS